MRSHLELARLFKSIDSWKTAGTDTQYRVIEEQDETIIIFDASNSRADWRINLNFPKRPYKKMDVNFTVHRGFLKEWKLIQDLFVDYFWNKLERGEGVKPITATGWSYGGAMATLAMEQIWHDFPIFRDDLKLVTFGSPRCIGILNFRKARKRWERGTLYRNGADFVTMIPFVPLGFLHVRRVTKIGPRWTLAGIFKTGETHKIESYIKSLEGVDG